MRVKFLLKLMGAGFLASLLIGLLLFIYYAKDLPRPELFTERPFIQPTKIYDRTGEVLLYQIYDEEKRTVVSLNNVPDHVKQAIISAEDANFYNHFGVDFKGILRSAFNNLKSGKLLAAGGSTITQQLIRSSFLTLDKTIKRKIKELILTLELERRYSKDQILEFYINQVPFGSNAYGVEAASQAFFNKPVSDVSLEEAALLASLVQAPSRLSPYGSYLEDLLARKDYVLNRMQQEGYISKEEADQAKAEVLEFAKITQPIKAPHFVLHVKQQLEEKYSDYFLKEKGLKVYTTLNWELQEKAEKIVQEGVASNKNSNAHNASLIAIDPKTGEIITMVGSADWQGESYPENCSGTEEGCLFEPKFNIATLGERQPGSAFKPFAYAQAFKEGFTPETILWDVKTEFNPNCTSTIVKEEEEPAEDEYGLLCYHPANYTGKFRGPLSMREALAQSINVPSVKTLYLAGLQDTLDLTKNMGLTTLDRGLSWYGLSLVLGGGEVKLIDLTSAYGVFATRGMVVQPITILKIEDAEGNIIEQNKKTPKTVLESNVADLINDILSDNEARAPLFGYNSPLYIPGESIATKTGTTQEYKDAWTIGYSTSLVVGVWAGNNNNVPANRQPGVVLAGIMWNRYMREALLLYPGEDFIKPKPSSVEKPILKGEINWTEPHSILYYLDKKDPQGAVPENPERDPQYENWEDAIEFWMTTSSLSA